MHWIWIEKRDGDGCGDFEKNELILDENLFQLSGDYPP